MTEPLVCIPRQRFQYVLDLLELAAAAGPEGDHALTIRIAASARKWLLMPPEGFLENWPPAGDSGHE